MSNASFAAAIKAVHLELADNFQEAVTLAKRAPAPGGGSL
jgi:hypothetical protein